MELKKAGETVLRTKEDKLDFCVLLYGVIRTQSAATKSHSGFTPRSKKGPSHADIESKRKIRRSGRNLETSPSIMGLPKPSRFAGEGPPRQSCNLMTLDTLATENPAKTQT